MPSNEISIRVGWLKNASPKNVQLLRLLTAIPWVEWEDGNMYVPCEWGMTFADVLDELAEAGAPRPNAIRRIAEEARCEMSRYA